jgi:hypothetical protein
MLAALATRTRRRVETEVVVEKNMMFVGWCSAEAVKVWDGCYVLRRTKIQKKAQNYIM